MARQVATSHHTRLLVYEGDVNNIKGVLHVRRAAAALHDGNFNRDRVIELLAEPYFIPAATPVFQQLQFFQERKQRLALVVDEYGDLQGLVSLKDIVEEMIGEFTADAPFAGSLDFKWGPDDTVVMEGGTSLREINRRLGLRFPVDGPKTLNGLILEHLQDIPESGLSLRIAGCTMEILQTQDRLIRTVRLRRFAKDDQTDAAP